jgi:hypothetical protein
MACACGTKKPVSSTTYVHTSPTGEQKTYKTEVEAAAATQRLGGTYRPQ